MPSPVTSIFIPRLLLWHLFSFPAFSYGAYFHSPPSPIALINPSPSLLWGRGIHAPLQKPNTGTLPVKLVVHGIKIWEMNAPPPPPNLLGINPPPRPTPCPLHARTARWPLMGGGGGEDFDPFPLQTSVQCWTTKEEKIPTYSLIFAYFLITLIFIWRLLLRRIFSLSAFSYDANYHLAHAPSASIFIPRILLWRLFSLCVISYDADLHSAHSPTALKEKRRRGKKITLWKIPKGSKMQIFEKIRRNTVKWR
jgi:hypothetical protein